MPRLLVVTVRRTSLCRQNNCSTIAESLKNVQLKKKKNTYTTVVLAQSEWCYWTALRESFVVERGIVASELLLQFCVFLLPHWYKPIQIQLKIYCTFFPKILISFYICTILSTFITLIMVQIFIENAGVVADLWPNNSIIMRHFFKNNSRIMQTYNYLFVSIISFVNMNNMKITPNATMCSSIISLFLLITLFTVQL